MAYRIEIGLRPGVNDARGELTRKKAATALGIKLAEVIVRTAYKIDTELSMAEVELVCREFAEPVTEISAAGRLTPPSRFDWIIEIGFKPGVTDNVGRTARSALADILNRKLPNDAAVYTVKQYFIRGSSPLPRRQAVRLAEDFLANRLIQTISVFSPKEWRTAPPDTTAPAIRDCQSVTVNTYNLSGSDADLLRISREHILSCSLDEMHAIRDHFNRPTVRRARQAMGLPVAPTDVEVECIAQSWSEHCSHKIFAAKVDYRDEHGYRQKINSLYKTFIKDATKKIAQHRKWLVSVFTDNAGIIQFDKKWNLVYKVETHNSPSALDPYGGAMTGVVGVNRDPMGTGMGATLLCNVWGYCLGSPFYRGRPPKGLMHPRRIRDGVHQGVIDGGNQSGIPWMRGWEIFDERFIGKPLVFCGTAGLLPVKIGGRPSERKEISSGDLLVMAGGRIGKDGIHGATFSSEELREESPAQAVQIGDPITQRKLYEFLIEARDQGLYRCITDNGAGGLSCSAGEMGRLAGGVKLDLQKAPLKYHGLQPWEILLSEAQERMTLAVPPGKIRQFMRLAKRRDVEATALGQFTNSGVFQINYGKKVVGLLDMRFLYNGCPIMTLPARWDPPKVNLPRKLPHGRRDKQLLELLGDLNNCSLEYKSRQYDGEVKGLSVVKPFVGVYSDMPSDATVMRVDLNSRAGIVLAEGVNPFYSDIDTYAMAASVIDEAVRRAIAAGADPEHLAGLDNFCWPDPVESEKTPDGAYKMAQLVRACRAVYDITTAYNVPCISGKDSCKNDSTRGGRKISIPPTLLFSVIAKINDVANAMTMDVKQAGDLLYCVGLTRPELGASAYHRLLAQKQKTPDNFGGVPPALDPKQALLIYQALHQAINAGIIHSAHTPTRGGLARAMALTALGGNLGIEADLGTAPVFGSLSDDELLFSESNSRFLVTAPPDNAKRFKELFNGLPCAQIGRVTSRKKLLVRGRSESVIIDTELRVLRENFKATLKGI